MTNDEKAAREILDAAIKLNCPVLMAKNLYVSVEGPAPMITDDECRSISVNYPLSWEEIRRCFDVKVDADD